MTITDPTTSHAAVSDAAIEEFADKLFGDLLGTLSVYACAMGIDLGWYAALAGAESMTSLKLASATSTDERYAREWLEQQTVAGYLTVVDAAADPTDRRYRLSPAAAEVLTNRDSLAYMAPFAGLVTSLGSNLAHLVEVYRTGDGFGWDQHGDPARCGQAEANRPMFLNLLARNYLASIDDIHAVLSDGGRVADIGCGLGWSSIGVAQAYPNAIVDGYDIDAPSIRMAEANAADAGVADRVTFRHRDVAEGGIDVESGNYDLALALECIHDMPDPVSVLAAMRTMVTPGGTVIVMDERVGDVFTGAGDAVEQLLYGFSLICCLPDGRNAPQSVATGTIMRRPIFEAYAEKAGFSSVEVLPIENDFFRFYRLNP